jgi:tRNA U55 pseudouridine synthase TruB
MALDSGAFLSTLRREQVGDYTLTNAVALEDVEQFFA